MQPTKKMTKKPRRKTNADVAHNVRSSTAVTRRQAASASHDILARQTSGIAWELMRATAADAGLDPEVTRRHLTTDRRPAWRP
jgi:hypothetical protein